MNTSSLYKLSAVSVRTVDSYDFYIALCRYFLIRYRSKKISMTIYGNVYIAGHINISTYQIFM